jgi:hypothetical protein
LDSRVWCSSEVAIGEPSTTRFSAAYIGPHFRTGGASEAVSAPWVGFGPTPGSAEEDLECTS